MTQYVIVGNSIAGVTAAETIRSLDPKGKIIIISEENECFYSRCLLPHYIQGLLTKGKLYLRNNQFYKELGISLYLGERIEDIDVAKQILISKSKKKWNYDFLLLATGARPTTPKPTSSIINGIFSLRTLEDTDRILQHLQKAKHILVVGGGMIGTKITYAINQLGLPCSLVIKSDRLLSQVLDKEASAIYDKYFRAAGVRIHYNTGVKEFLINDKRNKIIGFLTDEGEEINGDLIIFCKGVVPNIEFVQGTKLVVNTGICVNNRMQTNISNIYSAGDVAEKEDFFRMGRSLTAIWPEAAEQGRIAGSNMAGKKMLFEGSISRNSFNVFNIPSISMGIVNDYGTDCEAYSVLKKKENKYVKLVFKKQFLVGAILTGNISEGGLLLASIRKKMHLRDIKDDILQHCLKESIYSDKFEIFW